MWCGCIYYLVVVLIVCSNNRSKATLITLMVLFCFTTQGLIRPGIIPSSLCVFTSHSFLFNWIRFDWTSVYPVNEDYWPNKTVVVVSGCSIVCSHGYILSFLVHYSLLNRTNGVTFQTKVTSSIEWFIDIFLNILWSSRNVFDDLLIEKLLR